MLVYVFATTPLEELSVQYLTSAHGICGYV